MRTAEHSVNGTAGHGSTSLDHQEQPYRLAPRSRNPKSWFSPSPLWVPGMELGFHARQQVPLSDCNSVLSGSSMKVKLVCPTPLKSRKLYTEGGSMYFLNL